MISGNKVLKNISWNSLGSLSTALIFFICSPIYLSILGIDNFAYIGLWQTFMVVITLFDFGFGPTIAKEFSNPNAGIVKYKNKAIFFNSIERINYLIVGILCIATVTYSCLINVSDKNENIYLYLSLSVITFLPMLLYQNALLGLQQQREMNIFIIAFNISRHFIGIVVLYLTYDVEIFFIFQTINNLTLILLIKSHSNKKMLEVFPDKKGFSFDIMKLIIPFSLGMAGTSLLGLFISNFDKVALAFIGTNQNISVYILAFTAASILQLVIQPFYKTFYPIFSELQSSPKRLEEAFNNASKYFSVLIFPIYLFAFIFAEELIFSWISMDDNQLITIFRILLTCFLFTGLIWLPAAFQQARAVTNLHNSMMLLSIILGAVAFIHFQDNLGLMAFCLIWCFHAFTGFVIEIPIMYKNLLNKMPFKWYFETTIKPLFLFFPSVIASLALKFLTNINTYLLLAFCIMIFAITTYLVIKRIPGKII